jgi:hypothetical protein
MSNRTDQPRSRRVKGRVAPPTTPDRATIAEDREAAGEAHVADRAPTPTEERVAERFGKPQPRVRRFFKQAMERGARQEGEGRPGL